jgi:hypothetical protein
MKDKKNMTISKKELKSIINEVLDETIDYNDYESIDTMYGDNIEDLEDSVDQYIQKIKSDSDDDGIAYKRLVDINKNIGNYLDKLKGKERERMEHLYEPLLGKIQYVISGGGGAEKFYMKESFKISKGELILLIRESIDEILSEGKIQDPDKNEMMQFLLNKYDKLADKDDIKNEGEVAIYYFAEHYHGGQWSNLYKVLSNSLYKPGPNSSIEKEGGLALDMYHDLEHEFGGKRDIEFDISGSHDELPGENPDVPAWMNKFLKECGTWEEAAKNKSFHVVILKEVAPPGMEKFVRRIKPVMIKKYGKAKGLAIAYATAWKRFYKNKKAKNNESYTRIANQEPVAVIRTNKKTGASSEIKIDHTHEEMPTAMKYTKTEKLLPNVEWLIKKWNDHMKHKPEYNIWKYEIKYPVNENMYGSWAENADIKSFVELTPSVIKSLARQRQLSILIPVFKEKIQQQAEDAAMKLQRMEQDAKAASAPPDYIKQIKNSLLRIAKWQEEYNSILDAMDNLSEKYNTDDPAEKITPPEFMQSLQDLSIKLTKQKIEGLNLFNDISHLNNTLN